MENRLEKGAERRDKQMREDKMKRGEDIKNAIEKASDVSNSAAFHWCFHLSDLKSVQCVPH